MVRIYVSKETSNINFNEIVDILSDYSILFYSILGCVLPLQEVACRQSPPTFSVLC